MAKGLHSSIVDRSTEHSYLVANEDVRGVGQPYMLQADFREASTPLDPNRVLGSVTSLSMAAIPSPIVGKYIQLPDGTVGTPGLSWASDTDTGFYRTTANEFNIASGGAKVAEFNSSGLLLSSISQTQVLFGGASGQVVGDGTDFTYDSLSNILTVAGRLRVGTATTDSNNGDILGGLSGAQRLWWDVSNSRLHLYDSGNNEDVRIDLGGDSWFNHSGNTGFNNASPDKRVEITDGTQAQLRLSGTLGVSYADFRQQDSGTLLIENTNGITVFEQFPPSSGSDIEVWIGSYDSSGGDSILKIRNYDNAAGDSFIQFKVGSGSSYWSLGEDNDDSDAFVVARGQALGTTNALRIDTNRFSLFTPGALSSGTAYGMQLTSPVHTGGSNGIFKVLGGASTGQTTLTEIKLVDFDLSATITWAAGAITNERAFCIEAPTLAFASASTVTNAATVYIDRAPQAGTNATITNAYALWVDAGTARFDGSVGIGTTGPDRPLDVLDTAGPQLRLTYADGSVYNEFETNSSGVLGVISSGNRTRFINSTSAQILEIYNTSDSNTSPANLERVSVGWSGNVCFYRTTQAGTGTARELAIGTAGNAPCTIQTSATARVTVLGAGQVGINTTGPDRMLDVLDTAGAQLRLTYTDGSVYTDFHTSSAGALLIDPSGSAVRFRASALNFTLTGTATNTNITLRYEDNATTLKGRLIYAGGNGAGSRYFGFINDSADYLGYFSDTYNFWNLAGGQRALAITTSAVVLNEDQVDMDVRIEGDSISHLFFTDATATTENIAIFATAAPGWNTMDRGLFFGDTTNAPTGNPTGGGYLYSEAGALKWRGSSGTVTTIAAA